MGIASSGRMRAAAAVFKFAFAGVFAEPKADEASTAAEAISGR
jgi:hypothetical protein